MPAPSACKQGFVVQWLLKSPQREREIETESDRKREFFGTVVLFCSVVVRITSERERERVRDREPAAVTTE